MAFKYGSNSSLTPADALVRGIGLFSIGLGMAELIAPGRIAKPLGLEGKENLLRAYGLREIGAGISTLSTDPQPALWSRVAGDVLDLATLALGARDKPDAIRRNAGMAMAAVAGITVLDALAATLMGKRGGVRAEPADYSDRSGFPGGVEAARGYYAQRRTRGPAVASHDAREDRTHSGARAGDDSGGAGSGRGGMAAVAGGGRAAADGQPTRTETDVGSAPLPAGMPLG